MQKLKSRPGLPGQELGACWPEGCGEDLLGCPNPRPWLQIFQCIYALPWGYCPEHSLILKGQEVLASSTLSPQGGDQPYSLR